MVRQSPSNPQAHPRRLARAASLTALAAALSIGLPAGAQAEEPAAAGPDTQAAVEQPAAEEPSPSSVLADGPVDGSDLPAGTGTPDGAPADADSSADEETPTPAESGVATETGSTATADAPAAGAPVQTEEGTPEQDPQPAPSNEAGESDASDQTGAADQTAGAEIAVGTEVAGAVDPSAGANSAEAIATDAAASPTPADAAVLEEGSSDDPAEGQDGSSGAVELLAGDGFRYAFVTDGAECILWDYVMLEGVVEVPYVGPGVYLWVDADVASFTTPRPGRRTAGRQRRCRKLRPRRTRPVGSRPHARQLVPPRRQPDLHRPVRLHGAALD